MLGILTYSTIVILALASIYFRRGVLLLMGEKLLIFNLVFAAVSILAAALTGRLLGNLLLIGFVAALLAVSFPLRKKWLLFRHDPFIVCGAIEESSARILMPFEKSERGYILGKAASNKARLHIVENWPNFAIMSFEAGEHVKKVGVLQGLLKKSFNGIFPRPVIRL